MFSITSLLMRRLEVIDVLQLVGLGRYSVCLIDTFHEACICNEIRYVSRYFHWFYSTCLLSNHLQQSVLWQLYTSDRLLMSKNLLLVQLIESSVIFLQFLFFLIVHFRNNLTCKMSSTWKKNSEDQVYVIVIWTLGCPLCLAVSCQTQ